MIVSDVIDVALSQQAGEPKEAYSQEITGAQMSSEEDTPARNRTESPDMDEAAVFYAHVMEGPVLAKETCRIYVALKIKKLFGNKTYSLKSSSRTAALWLQYMNMADILHMCLRSECTGNWAPSLRLYQKCFLSW